MTEETGKEILSELQRLNAIMSNRRRWTHVVAIILFGLFLLAVYGPQLWRPRKDSASTVIKEVPDVPDSWQEAQQLFEKGKSDDAREMIQGLLLKHPESDYGYALLGFMYQQDGNLTLAETNYAKAFQLLPDETNEKALAAVRKAIANKNATANQAMHQRQ